METWKSEILEKIGVELRYLSGEPKDGIKETTIEEAAKGGDCVAMAVWDAVNSADGPDDAYNILENSIEDLEKARQLIAEIAE